MRRSVLELAGVAAVAVLGIAALALFQRHFIYFPDPADVPPAASLLPGASDVRVETEDGLLLGAWLVPPRGPARGAVLVANGNAGDRSDRAPLAAALSREGYAVLLFDYRGYGGNPGQPTESGLLADARAAARYLASRADVDPARIAYFGESLGAAVVIALAVERPPAALVLRSPFTSLQDMRRLHYPLLPFDFLLMDRYPAIAQVGRVAAPVLVVAGERDGVVPVELSRRLFEAASEPKRLVVLAGADHNDPALFAGPRLVAEVARFLAEFVR